MESKTLVLLAGGAGSRLNSYLQKTDHIKCLSDFSGSTFLNYLLRQAEAAGIENVIILAGPNRRAIMTAVQADRYKMDFSFPEEVDRLGTGGALRLATPYVREEFFYLSNADTYFPENPFVRIRKFVRLAAVDVRTSGLLFFESDNISERNFQLLNHSVWPDLYSTMPYVYVGVSLLKRDVIESVSEMEACSFEKELFARIKESSHCYAYTFEHVDFGTAQGFEILKAKTKMVVSS